MVRCPSTLGSCTLPTINFLDPSKILLAWDPHGLLRLPALHHISWISSPVDLKIGKYVEAFEEGMSFKDVEKKTADLLSRKTKLEARKRAVSK